MRFARRESPPFTACVHELAHDWAGRPWDDEWRPITCLKRQRYGGCDGLYEKARAMEATKYGAERGVAREESEGERRSPRLLEAHARGV